MNGKWVAPLALAPILGNCHSGSNAAGGSGGRGGASGQAATGGASTLGGTFGGGGLAASGGSIGSGGASAAGGMVAGGGSNGSGGLPAAGGTVGVGGITGSGGLRADGGTVGIGGVTGSGGLRAAGGTVGPQGGSGRGGSTPTTGGAGSGGTSGALGSGGGGGGTRPNSADGGISGAGGATVASQPCDIYQSGNTPCVAAHSTVRALYGAYSGMLYQVRRASDKSTKDIPLLTPGGVADSSVQVTFCSGTTCTISVIYDQSPLHNDLPVSPPVHWLPNGGKETDAAAGKITVDGHTVYGVYVVSDVGNSYRNNKAQGLATGDQSEAMYMVADGKRYNGRCCFDYGNVETSGNDDGNGTMETIEWGNITNWSPGTGSGPWVLADLENGVFAGGQTTGTVASNTPLVANYVTLMVKGPSGNHFALKGGDAQSGSLAVKYDGTRPPGYSPMHKQGAVELGVGGDGSAGGIGTFFEGAVTSGNPSDAIDDAVQANVVAAGYGK